MADHGQFSGIKGVTRARMERNIERTIDAAKREIAATAAEKARQDKERRKAAREAEAARPKLTAKDVAGARFVRDQFGWHKVVRVNKKTVTVETPYSWTETIALPKVLEVKR